MRRRRRLAGRLALPLGGGALVALSLPPFGPFLVGLLGMGAVVASLSERRLPGRLVAGLLAGIGQFTIGLFWAVQFSAAGYVALVLAESLIVAVAVALVPPAGPLRLAGAAGALTLSEWVRQSWPFGGLPLGGAALGQVGGPLQFAARLGGPLVVLFLLVLVGGALVELGRIALARRRRALRTAALPLVGLVAVAAVASGGALVPFGSGHDLSVAIVQGGGVRGLDELEVPPAEVLAATLSETSRVSGHPRLILWPEDVVSSGSTPFRRSVAAPILAAVARQHHAILVAGVVFDVGAHLFRNEVVAYSPAGRLVAVFEKVHRVPFGEYVPFRSFFSHFADLSDIPRDAIAGHGSGLIATPAGRFALLVSFEDFFSDRGRSGVRAGGRLILVPTNTSSYSSEQVPAQEIAASRLQAIAEGRYLCQAAPTGFSAVISPSGAVLQQSSLSRPAVLEAKVALLGSATPYEAAGDLPVVLLAAGSLAGAWVALLGERRRLRRSSDRL